MLTDPAFRDLAYAAEISKWVYRPPPPPPPMARSASIPHATTNQVLRAIASVAWLGQRLGLNLGSRTNLNDVDFEGSMVYADTSFSGRGELVDVWFKDGARLAAVGDVPVWWFADTRDAAPEDQTQSSGLARLRKPDAEEEGRWRQLATTFEHLLTERLGLKRAFFKHYPKIASGAPPKKYADGSIAWVVKWRPAWSKERPWDGVEPNPFLVAEFNLRTGEVMGVYFSSPESVKAVKRARAKWK